MHIAFVNQWYPPESGGGGVATHNYNLATTCARLGHRVTAIAVQRVPDQPARCVIEGVTVIRVPAPDLYRLRHLPLIGRQYRFLQGLIYSARVCKALGLLNQETPIDIAEFAEVNAEGSFWHRGLSRRLVVRCHTPAYILSRYYTRDETPYATNWIGWAEKRVIRRADALTAPSKDMARLIAETCGVSVSSIEVIPNALDTIAFAPLLTHSPSNMLDVLFVGRLERAKGIDVLAEAIPLVCAQFPRVRFIIAGGSRPHPSGIPYGDHLRHQLAPFVASGQVLLLGFVDDPEMVRLYQSCAISVVPSLLYESFSLTVAQGMASGLAVIGSRIGGIPETLDYGRCGVIVQPNSVKELIDALLDLVQNSAKRHEFGSLARTHAVSLFSTSVVANRILDLYHGVLG